MHCMYIHDCCMSNSNCLSVTDVYMIVIDLYTNTQMQAQ